MRHQRSMRAARLCSFLGRLRSRVLGLGLPALAPASILSAARTRPGPPPLAPFRFVLGALGLALSHLALTPLDISFEQLCRFAHLASSPLGLHCGLRASARSRWRFSASTLTSPASFSASCARRLALAVAAISATSRFAPLGLGREQRDLGRRPPPSRPFGLGGGPIVGSLPLEALGLRCLAPGQFGLVLCSVSTAFRSRRSTRLELHRLGFASSALSSPALATGLAPRPLLASASASALASAATRSRRSLSASGSQLLRLPGVLQRPPPASAARIRAARPRQPLPSRSFIPFGLGRLGGLDRLDAETLCLGRALPA